MATKGLQSFYTGFSSGGNKMMKAKFHEYDRKLERSLEILDEKPLTANNGFYVRKIVEFLQSQGLTSARLLKYVEILRKLDRLVEKDFKVVSKDDLVEAVRISNKILVFGANRLLELLLRGFTNGFTILRIILKL